MKNRILIVDDEPANLRLLERLFASEYEVKTAASGADALDLLRLYDAALIISDQRMPGMTGIEFLKKAAEMRPQTVRIILTGYTDVSDLVEAINSGVIYRYITKPWVNTDLMQSVTRGIEYYETIRSQHLIAEENERLKKRLQNTIRSFVNSVRETIALKKSGLGEHCRRTSHYAALIGERLVLGPADLEHLVLAALLHEAPALRIPFDLEMTRSALTSEQFRVTQNSYENGLSLISVVPDLQDVADVIAFQHEHFDGTGLFQGLKGEKIPLLSRILAVANSFDQISCLRNAAIGRISGDPAALLRSKAGNVLDPTIVEVFLSLRLIESANKLDQLSTSPTISATTSAAA